MNYTWLIAGLASFIVVLYLTPWLIRYLKKIEVVVPDVHKEDKPLIPISGGLVVMAGLFTGLMIVVFFETFFFKDISLIYQYEKSLMLIFAGTTSILLITFVGFVDDIIIERSKGESSGLRQWQKPLLTLSAAIPLMVINAGSKKMLLPFIGHVNFGLIYPFLLVPIGVIGAANMVNLLGGFNGVEAGMGLIYMLSLGLYAYTHKSYIAALFALMTFAALLAFFKYNKNPSKIFPGDSLTYLLGGVLAIIAIIGDMERVTLIISIPFMIEALLKLRGKFKKTSIGYCKDGKVVSHYDKIYSIPHILTKTGKFTEKQVFWFLMIIQAVFAAIIWI